MAGAISEDAHLRSKAALVSTIALVALLVAALTGLMMYWRSGGTAAQSSGIPAAELHGLPPLVFSWQEQRPGPGNAGGVYTTRVDGSGLRRVYGWPSRALEDGDVYGAEGVAWSPNRREVAIETWLWFGDPFSRVAIVSADGKKVRALEGLDCCGRSLAWSPAGTGLLFSRYNELHVFRSETGRADRIWRRSNHGRFEGVDWSPDGRELVAASDSKIVRVTAAGDEVQWLTRPGAGAIDRSPQWSPDGRKIVFTRGSHVYTVTRAGHGIRLLNRKARGDGALWSPNGQSILLTRVAQDSAPKDVLVMRSSGRGLRALKTGAPAAAVDWSPDGTKILFLREARDAEKPSRRPWWELWVMDVDGGRQTRLPFNTPGWSVLAADWRS